MESRQVFLIDGTSQPPGVVVEASLTRDLSPDCLETIEESWAPARRRAAEARRAEHAHWDWRNKSDLARHRIIAIECGGDAQGLMAVLRKPRPPELAAAPGPVVYVDFLEVAPWNLSGGPAPPRFRGVGSVLVREAIRLSRELGLGGRVGLHSLPQSEGFYLSHCGMTRVGPDNRYYELVYFEYTEQQAADWLAGSGE